MEFNDPDANHIGIQLNDIESVVMAPAGYYSLIGGFVPIQIRSGQNIRAWIEFDETNFDFNVTVAPETCCDLLCERLLTKIR